MSRPPTSPGRAGRPPVTSRTQILAAARRLIDRDGWERLTIRRLATELGIGATTLYHHIQNKEDLLVLLLNQYIDQLERPELPDEPRARVIAVASAMHDALNAWPWAAETLTVDGFVGLLDESALWMVEAIVAGAVRCGCTTERAVTVFRSIWYYTVGEILVRARTVRRRADGPGAGDRKSSFDGLDASQVPYLAEIGDRWVALSARDTYQQGLRALVDGLLPPAAPPRP
ncbi:TetR/AcrR family transcriptional regulator [Streptomyces sp. TP-A0874]|uniref:TetR/AcrR family transcriptional regulator n=1 Tax=Streptomyces sp. TP-A0874 TaxID=549819 RepID=UPI000853CC37|nr:TetR/AcrR family transcriptional regulator [Streptomyces sp. TP-A0874]